MNAAIASLAKRIQSLCKGDFREEDHPRADDGKFGSGGGSNNKNPDRHAAFDRASSAEAMPGYTPDDAKLEASASALADAARNDSHNEESREIFASSVTNHANATTSLFASLGRAAVADLEEAGAEPEAIVAVVAALDRGVAAVARAGEKLNRAAGKLNAARAAKDSLPPLGERPDPPDIDDVARDLFGKDYGALEGEQADKVDAEHTRRDGTWEKDVAKWDKLEERHEAAQARIDEAADAFGEASDALRETYAAHGDRLSVAVDEAIETADPDDDLDTVLLNLPAALLRLKGAWREEDHDRADDGKFGSGGGGSKKPAKKPSALSEAREGGKTAVRVAGKLASKLSSLASSAKEGASRWARKLSAGLKGNLSPRMRKRLKTAGKWVAGLEHFLNAAKSGAQAVAADVAEQEARLRGLTPGDAKKHGDRVGKVVKAADAIASWVENVPLAHDVLHHVAHAGSVTSFLAAKAAFYVPVGSLAYLAMATAANPIAVMDSASKLIAGKLSGGKHKAEDGSDAAKALSAGLLDAADQEVYLARVFAGLDLTGGDMSRAVKLASAEEKKSLASVLHKLRLALKGNFREEDHPRADDGKFGSGGGGGGKAKPKKPNNNGGSAAKEPAKESAEDPAEGRPSKPDERHTNSDGSAPLPKPKEWKAPPPKKPRPPGEKFTRPKGEQSQTVIGDLGEELARPLGFRSILPPGQRSHKPGEVEEKGSTIDLEYDHSGRAYELKLCNTTATEYRLKAKASEKGNKLKYADMHDLTPHTLVAVRDVDTGEVHFYASKEPGLIGAEVSDKKFDYVGSVKP